jgi:hypothetical protein
MGKFEVFFEAAEFYVIRTSAVDTGSSVIYEYEIGGIDGETLQLTVPGSNKIIIQDGSETVLVDGNFTFSNSMNISFTISTGSSFGAYTTGLLQITRVGYAASRFADYSEIVTLLRD